MSKTYRSESETCETCEGEGFVKSASYSRRCLHFGNDPACSCWERCEDCDGEGVIHDWQGVWDLPHNEQVCATCGAWRKVPA